jgi:hypothetical protein
MRVPIIYSRMLFRKSTMAWAFSRVPGKTVQVIVAPCLRREMRKKRERIGSASDSDKSEDEDSVNPGCALLIMKEKNQFELYVNIYNCC